MRYQDDPDIRKKYNSRQWRKLRKIKIASVNGLCERCLKEHIFREGKIVHHKIHITKDNYLDDNVMYNLDNLELLCDDCHIKEHFDKKSVFDDKGNYLGE